jgi:hypothetical protein
VRDGLEETRRGIESGDVGDRVPLNSVDVNSSQQKIRNDLESRFVSSKDTDIGTRKNSVINNPEVQNIQNNVRTTFEYGKVNNDNGVVKAVTVDRYEAQLSSNKIRNNIQVELTEKASYSVIGKQKLSPKVSFLSSINILRLLEGPHKRMPDGRIIVNDPQIRTYDISTARVFGVRSPSKNFMKSSSGRIAFYRAMRKFYNGAKNAYDQTDFGSVRKSAGKGLVKNAIKTLEVIDFVDDTSDTIQLVSDSVYYKKFPNMEDLLSPGSARNQVQFSIDKQTLAVNDFNNTANTLNTRHLTMSASEKAQDYDYPYHHAKYPYITGPLDVVDAAQAQGDAYWVSTRVEAEIDSIREMMLRNPTSQFATKFKASWQLTNQAYQDLISNKDVSLTSMWDEPDEFVRNFSQTDWETLYRYAFAFVCKKNNGLVYEDTYPEQKDSTGQVIIKSHTRFQCGYKDSNACKTAGNKYFTDNVNVVLGNYAEWFSFGELNTIIASLTNPVRSSIAPTILTYTDTTADGKPLNPTQSSDACVVTNSGLRTMCNRQDEIVSSGTVDNYNPDTHQCRFSTTYCKKLGTCFDNSTGQCYLPNGSAFQGISSLLGDTFYREWISVNGCSFTSGQSDAQIAKDVMSFLSPDNFFGKSGGTMLSDAFKNHKNWGEGLRVTLSDPMNAVNFSSMAFPAAQGLTTKGISVLARLGSTNAAKALRVMNSKAFTAFGRTVTRAGAAGLAIQAALMITIVVLQVTAKLEELREVGLSVPRDVIGDFTVTGWSRDEDDPFGDTFMLNETGGALPTSAGFVDGWVTKPLLARNGSSYDSAAASRISQIYSTTKGNFYSQRDTDIVNNLANILYIPFGRTWGDALSDYLGWPAAYNYRTDMNAIYGKMYCSKDFTTRMWRSGSQSSTNSLWCLPEKPPETWAHPEIGPLAKIISIQMTGGTITRVSSTQYNVTGVTVVDDGRRLTNGLFLKNDSVTGGVKAVITNVASSGDPPIWSFTFTLKTSPSNFTVPNSLGVSSLAEISESQHSKNRVWTDGTDPGAPNFPEQATPNANIRSDRSNDIYYQLVYDKSIFQPSCTCSEGEVKDSVNNECQSTSFLQSYTVLPNATCNSTQHTLIGTSCVQCPVGYDIQTSMTAQSGFVKIAPTDLYWVSCAKSCLKLPALLFNDTVLARHFSYDTINTMRRSMCQEQLIHDNSGKTVDSRCWGYLSVAFTGYKFLPMTIVHR